MKDVNRLRYADDNVAEHEGLFLKQFNNSNTHRMHLLSTSLKITKEITPKIYNIIDNILTQLEILDINLECYVYNDAEMNASCFSIEDNTNIVIMISSGLVNNMKEDELAFVIGHEIGHYIFGHLEYREIVREKNELLDMKISRVYQSHEISADRIGLICSGSIESSLRAIIKTVSGLSDEFITHNLHSYLHQIQSLKYDDLAHSKHTHPIFPIRAKSLTLFSMSELYYWWINDTRKAPLNTEILTKKIRKDLESTTLKSLRDESTHIVEKFQLWFYVKSFTEDNKLDKNELSFLENQFGSDTAIKALRFAEDNSIGVNKKYEEFRSQVHHLPFQHRLSMVNDMKGALDDTLSSHNVQKYFKKLTSSILGE